MPAAKGCAFHFDRIPPLSSAVVQAAAQKHLRPGSASLKPRPSHSNSGAVVALRRPSLMLGIRHGANLQCIAGCAYWSLSI